MKPTNSVWFENSRMEIAMPTSIEIGPAQLVCFSS